MNWLRAIPENELRLMERYVLRIMGKDVLLIHLRGEYFAVDNACPHMRLPLTAARIDAESCTLHCPWHRSAFDLHTGDVRDWAPWPPAIGPMLGAIRREQALTRYRVKVEDGDIYVSFDPPDGEASAPSATGAS